MKTLKAIIRLMRPYQWAKNTLIFFPMFFHGTLLNVTQIIEVLYAFIGFSLVASSIYCFNDLTDIEADREHPEKSKRPLASGIISKKTVIAVMIFLLLLGFGFLALSNDYEKIFVWALAYCLINVLYSLKLKEYAIVDTLIIASGFVIRIFIGSYAGDVVLSQWIIIMTFLLALFLSFAKRRDDYIIFNNTGEIHRESIVQYNLEFLNITLGILASVTIVAYIMYTISPEINTRFGGNRIYYSTVFVVAGFLRYMQLVIVRNKSDDPTRILLKDRFLQLCIFFWMLFFAIVIYI